MKVCLSRQEADDRHSSDAEGLLEQLRVCEAALVEERRLHASTREELARSSLEADQCRGDLLRERAAFSSQLQVRAYTHVLYNVHL